MCRRSLYKAVLIVTHISYLHFKQPACFVRVHTLRASSRRWFIREEFFIVGLNSRIRSQATHIYEFTLQ